MTKPLRLTWKRTHTHPQDSKDDFLCFDGELPVGRIYKSHKPGSIDDQWLWFVNGVIGNVFLSGSGKDDDKNVAARACEAEYFASLERIAKWRDKEPKT